MEDFNIEAAKRVNRYRSLAYGMFIHYGLYSLLECGEWVFDYKSLDMNDYSKLKNKFTSENFNTEQIARLASESGMKYICLTTRHHDGFSLYDTCGLNDFDAPHSAAKRDIVKDFVESCKKYGLVPMLYHTTLDWYKDLFKNNFKEYLQYLRDSVEILCTNYGEIGGLWFDGNWSKPDDDWHEQELYEMIRKHQPDAIIIDNTGLEKGGKTGHYQIDCVTFEQQTPENCIFLNSQRPLAGEMCKTVNSHWGWAKNDFKYLSIPDVIQDLCLCRSCCANYLMNVGPDGSGKIGDYESALIRRVGDWIRLNPEAIYNASPTLIKGVGKDFVLENGNNLYLFIHDLHRRGSHNVVSGRQKGSTLRIFGSVKKPISKLKWVDNDQDIEFSYDPKTALLSFDAEGYDYGNDLVVRIARAVIE